MKFIERISEGYLKIMLELHKKNVLNCRGVIV